MQNRKMMFVFHHVLGLISVLRKRCNEPKKKLRSAFSVVEYHGACISETRPRKGEKQHCLRGASKPHPTSPKREEKSIRTY